MDTLEAMRTNRPLNTYLMARFYAYNTKVPETVWTGTGLFLPEDINPKEGFS